MPKKRFRLLLVAMLIALVPLQGLAALSIGICRDLERSAGAMAAVHAHGDDGHAEAASGHEPKAAGDHHTAHCAACAACGVSAGIVARAPFPIAESPRSGVIAHTASQFSGYVPERIDRPPLTPLA